VYTTRTTCRLCEGPLEDILNLGDIHLSTFLGIDDELPPKAPLDLVRCVDCNLFQLRHTVDQDAMYSKYWYKSGLNNSMREALHNVVDCVQLRKELQQDSVVLDIGANDGTLLGYYPYQVIKVACEPSNIADEIVTADIIINDYFTAGNYFDSIHRKADVITAIAMFYDLEDPHIFVEDLKKVLADEGLLVIQMMDLMSMLKTGDFPNLCHEHLEYYSLSVLEALLWEHGLQIFDVEYNNVNGGSLRVYARHTDQIQEAPILREALEKEEQFFSTYPLSNFKEHVRSVHQKIFAFVTGAHSLDAKVAVLGASTKGNTMLQYFGLTDKLIDHAAEVNPDKYGKRTVGTNIPIISEQESLIRHPDYYLVLPWGFADFFVEKLKPYLQKGGSLIVPLPQPRVIYIDMNGEVRTTYL